MADRKPHKPAPPSKAGAHKAKATGKKASEDKTGSEEKAKRKVFKEIPLVSVPNEEDLIAEQMAEIFDEDRVTHKHGSAEPEAD
jgi:hypothetical protein